MMKITTEILARYVEDTLPKEQKSKVQQYLATHPKAMEAVLRMMDDDYDLIPQGKSLPIAIGRPVVNNNLCLTAAAFAMPINTTTSKPSFGHKKNDFCAKIDELIDSLL